MAATKIRLQENQNKKTRRIILSWESLTTADENINENALSRYNMIVSKILEKNAKVVLVLSINAMPEWLTQYGGWENRRTADEFVRYATNCIEYFGNRITRWEILNVVNEEIAHISTMALSVATAGSETAHALRSAYIQCIATARVTSFAHAFNHDIKLHSIVLSKCNTKGALVPLMRSIQRTGTIPEGIEWMIAIRGLGFRIQYEDKLELSVGIPDQVM